MARIHLSKLTALILFWLLVGQRLCEPGEDVVAGQGTHERDGVIYSSLAGLAEITEAEDKVIGMLESSPILLYMTTNFDYSRMTRGSGGYN